MGEKAENYFIDVAYGLLQVNVFIPKTKKSFMRATFRYFLTLLCDTLEDVFKVLIVFLKTFALTLYFAML